MKVSYLGFLRTTCPQNEKRNEIKQNNGSPNN